MSSIKSDLSEFEKRIGYSFKDRDFLKEALSHSSFVNELKINRCDCYERLEFLGDSILEFVSSDFLFEKYPKAREGELSKHRAALVCEKALAVCARNIGLGDFILLGRGEFGNKGYENDSILSDVLEAVIGAIYMDSNVTQASEFIYSFIIGKDDTGNYTDYKTILQELVQSRPGYCVKYELVDQFGPDHEKEFRVEVYINDVLMGEGTGRSKKQAEQSAACEAIKKLKVRN